MSPRTKILLMALVAALAFGLRLLPGPRTIDDAFITFRYARNLLEGSGPVFNPGERVLGTTTPLYMGLLTIVSLPLGGAHAPFPVIALLINALADALTCLLLIAVGRSLRLPAAGWAAALLWAVSPMSVTFAVGGMETSVYVLLLVSVFYFRLREKLYVMSFLSGLAFLCRPDALLLIAPLWIELFIRLLQRNGLRPALGKILLVSLPLLGILIAWFAFAYSFYGTLLPHSMLAKSVAYRLDPRDGLIRMIQNYATPFFEDLTFGTRIILVSAPVYLFLSVIGILAAEKLRPGEGAAAGLVFPWIYFLVFSIANPLIFRWYLAPPLPFIFLSLFIGLAALLGLAKPSDSGTARKPAILFGAIVFGCLLLYLRGWTLSPDHGPTSPAPEMAYIRLELLYRRVAEDLQKRLFPGQTVAAGDVGVLGYFLDTPILDTVGLNSAQSVRYYPLPENMYAIVYAIPPNLILDEKPAYVVLLEVYGRNGLLLDSRFLARYRICAEYPTDIYGSRSMLVYCRKDLP
ncbi:MAG: hypothetical protein ABSC61_11175 [Anaerolineales bacterium]